MSNSANNELALGKTAPAGERDHLLGQIGSFEDRDYSDPDGTAAALSQMRVEVIRVKNRTGSALLPGEIAAWHASYVGLGVNGKAAVASAGAGVVDPFLPAAGVADGLVFNLIRKGPCKVINDGTAAITAGQVLSVAATGRAILVTAAPADATAAQNQALSAFGRALADCVITAGTKFRALVNFRL